MNSIAPHISAFLLERLPVQRRASQHTCQSYADSFRLLFEFASARLKVTPSQLKLEQIDARLVMDFLDHLESDRGNSPRTRNVRLAAIKSFMRYMEFRLPSILEQSRSIRAIPEKRTDRRLITHLSLEEMQALLNAPDLKTRDGIRDRAMLHLGFACGLRVSELVTLPMTAVSLGSTPTIRILGKGRRERLLPLWKQTTADLRNWLSVRGNAAATELFLNAQGTALTRFGFDYIITKYTAAAAGNCPSLSAKKITPHVLRHSCAMIHLHATNDLRKVSLWLGHANMQTTQMYVDADPSEKLEVMEQAIPPSLKRGRFTAPDKLMNLLRGR